MKIFGLKMVLSLPRRNIHVHGHCFHISSPNSLTYQMRNLCDGGTNVNIRAAS